MGQKMNSRLTLPRFAIFINESICMRNIKFKSPDDNQTQFATAVRKNVDQYFRETGISPKGDWTLRLKAFSMLAMYIAPFVLILTLPMSAWFAMLLFIIMGIGTAGVGMGVMHDAIHGSYSRQAWENTLMGSSMYLLGSHVFVWFVQHNVMHHTYTNIEGLDGDIGPRGPLRLSEHAPLKKMHRYQHWYAFPLYGLMSISKLVRDFSQLSEYNKAGITKAQRRSPGMEWVKLVSFKAIYLLAMIGLPLMLTNFNIWQILAGFFIMHWVTGVILATIFQLAHVVEGAEQPLELSNGLIENDWMVHELQTTANFARNQHLLNWYVGGLNFQIEHHLFPHVSHIHYPKIAPIVERTALEFGYNYNMKLTFMGALVSHVRRLKELGNMDPAMVVLVPSNSKAVEVA